MSSETRAPLASAATRKTEAEREQYYVASHWALMRRKFARHKLAVVGAVILALLYFTAAFAGFFAPYDKIQSRTELAYLPPTRIHLFHDGILQRPFVYGVAQERDMETFLMVFSEDRETRYPLRLFVKGDPYTLWGLLDGSLHLYGVDEPGVVYLYGGDDLGRDVFSRIIHGAQVSLSIGLVGIAISFVLGALLGGASGLIGGGVDLIIQRIVEFVEAMPTLPLWMALGAAIPIAWPTVTKYFLMAVILSILGWTGLARTVRGKILQLREEDFVTAAKVSGTTNYRVITWHMLPNFVGYLIVHITLAIPGMIIGETGLSFLGLGLTTPVVSWGVALQQAYNVSVIALNPWLLIPGVFVVVTVLCYNAVGDGLRDAADPYK
jgi:peptide/nickel transport system permease protein